MPNETSVDDEDLKVGERKVFNVGGSNVVESVEVVANKNVSDVDVQVRDVSDSDKYSDVVADDMIYNVVEVDFKGFSHEDVSDVKFKFSVDKSWVLGRGLTKDDVGLQGLKLNSWQSLKSDFVGEEDGKLFILL